MKARTNIERDSQDCPSHGVWIDGGGSGGGGVKKMDHNCQIRSWEIAMGVPTGVLRKERELGRCIFPTPSAKNTGFP